MREGGVAELAEVAVLAGHAGRVWSVAWSPSGAALASCGGDKAVRVWARERDGTWACKAVLEDRHTRTVRCAAWSPCSRRLATAGFDAVTLVWQRASERDFDFECVASLEGTENEVKGVAWSADGNLLAACSRDKSVWVWEAPAAAAGPSDDFECAAVLHGHGGDVKAVAWHPTRDILVSASYDDSIKIWAEDDDGEDWRCVQTLEAGQGSEGHASTVWAVAFDRDGSRLASCSDDCTVMIWDTSSDVAAAPWKHLQTIAGTHNRTIFSIDWSRLNGLIATGAGDDCIRLFCVDEDLHTAHPPRPFQLLLCRPKAHTTDVNCVRWHPKEAALLASCGDDELVRIWELRDGRRHDGNSSNAADDALAN
eukprot:SM000207S06169  [mRNA]  locus=s207:59623:62027:- [translate_table: standard]